jgi:hypothetical protein
MINSVIPPNCLNGTAQALNSLGQVIATWTVPSGGTATQNISDTAIVARNSNLDIIGSSISLAGALNADVNIADTTYNIYLDGVFKQSVTLPTLDPLNELNITLD